MAKQKEFNFLDQISIHNELQFQAIVASISSFLSENQTKNCRIFMYQQKTKIYVCFTIRSVKFLKEMQYSSVINDCFFDTISGEFLVKNPKINIKYIL